MKFILTHTYFLAEDPQEQPIMKPYPPLGLLYLSAYLKQNGLELSVIDTTFSSYGQLLQQLEKQKPDVLGIHCNLLTKPTVLKLIDYCRERGIISILGGPDASTQVDEFLTYGADAIVSGEGEAPLLAILQRLKTDSKHRLHGIANVSFRDENGTIIKNRREYSRRSLNEYPFPEREAIDMQPYFEVWERHHGMRPVSLITARGCAFTCKWCSHSVYAYTHRRRSPENVLAELKQVLSAYQPTHLWYADDVFTVNKLWMRKFHDLLMQENIRLPFECIGRADRFDAEMAQLLHEMGCYRIWFGAESGSQKVLDAMSRGVTREQIQNAIGWCQKRGIEAGVFVMFGYPGEDVSDIRQTIRFISEAQPDRYLTTVAYPLRGTRLYEEMAQKIIAPVSWEKQSQRNLDIRGRFTSALYQYAIKKLASDYRIQQLKRTRQQMIKRLLHRLRSAYCGFQIKRLASRTT